MLAVHDKVSLDTGEFSSLIGLHIIISLIEAFRVHIHKLSNYLYIKKEKEKKCHLNTE